MAKADAVILQANDAEVRLQLVKVEDDEPGDQGPVEALDPEDELLCRYAVGYLRVLNQALEGYRRP
jgi:hypothetical protein